MPRLASIVVHGGTLQVVQAYQRATIGAVSVDWTDNNVLVIENPTAGAVFFHSIGVGLEPGVEPWLTPYIGARKLGQKFGDLDAWSIFSPGDQAPRHAKFPVPAPGLFTLGPGHRIELRFAADPYPVPATVPPNVRFALDADRTDPALAALDGFWKMGDPSTYNVDDWVLRRFGTPSRIPVLGLHEFGRIPWGDVECNHHYDLIGCAIQAWLRTGDVRCWQSASIMAWRHLQTGVRLPSGDHEYEKCGGTYTGDGGIPLESHQWDAGLAAFARLTNDPTAIRWAQNRAQAVLAKSPASVWRGYGGSRFVGWFLRNLRVLHRLGFIADADFVAKAVACAAAFRASWVGFGTPYLPNGYTPGSLTGWFDGCAFVETIRALDDAGVDATPWRQGATWLLDNGVRDDGTSPYEVTSWQGSLAASSVNDSYPEAVAMWLVPIARLMNHPKRAALEQRARLGINVTQQGASAAGSAAVKLWAEATWGLGSVA